MGRQTTRFFRVPALLLDSSRPLCSFFVPSSNYDLAGALHEFLAALGATLGAGNATDHRPSLHRSPIQTRRNPVHHSSKDCQQSWRNVLDLALAHRDSQRGCCSFPEGGLAMLYLLGQEGHPPSGLTEEVEEKDYFDTIMDEQFNPKIGD
jgi:hypothetical protein